MSFDLVKGCDSRHLDHFSEHTLSINIKRNKHTHFLESNTKLKSIHQQQHNTTQLQLNVLYSCFFKFYRSVNVNLVSCMLSLELFTAMKGL